MSEVEAFLAVDPSFRNTGWAIMDKHEVFAVGLIETKKGDATPVYEDTKRCLQELTVGIDDAICLAEPYDVNRIYCEAMGGSKSAKAAGMMAMAQAVVTTAAWYRSYHLELMSAMKVKRLSTGTKGASKKQVKEAMKKRYLGAEHWMLAKGITQKARQEHIWDAIAIGYAIDTQLGSE